MVYRDMNGWAHSTSFGARQANSDAITKAIHDSTVGIPVRTRSRKTFDASTDDTSAPAKKSGTGLAVLFLILVFVIAAARPDKKPAQTAADSAVGSSDLAPVVIVPASSLGMH